MNSRSFVRTAASGVTIFLYFCSLWLLVAAPAYAQTRDAHTRDAHTRDVQTRFAKTPKRELVSLGADGYTVEQFGHAHRIETLRAQLRTRGGVEIQSTIGPVLVFGTKEIQHTADFRRLRTALQSIIPTVFSEVAQVVREYDFPLELKSDDFPWQLFLEKQSAAKRGMLSSERCHAAWMGPPANIFLSIDSFLSDCGVHQRRASSRDEELRRVLAHEVAHALEFRLMGKGFSRRQRWHSEGFASWFETLHREWQHDSLLADHTVELFRSDWSPVSFRGSRQDYARSYALIAALVERQGLETLFAVYARMDQQETTFEAAVQSVVGWDLHHWILETNEWLQARPYGMGAYAG